MTGQKWLSAVRLQKLLQMLRLGRKTKDIKGPCTLGCPSRSVGPTAVNSGAGQYLGSCAGASNAIKNIWELTVQEQRACYHMRMVPWSLAVWDLLLFCSVIYWKEAGSSCTCSMDRCQRNGFQFPVHRLRIASCLWDSAPPAKKTLWQSAETSRINIHLKKNNYPMKHTHTKTEGQSFI